MYLVNQNTSNEENSILNEHSDFKGRFTSPFDGLWTERILLYISVLSSRTYRREDD